MIVGRLVGHKGIHRQRKVVAVFVLMTIRRVEVNDNDAVRQACRQRASHQREKKDSKQQMIWKIWIRPADRQSSNFALLVEEHWHRPGGQECRQGRSIRSTGRHVLCEDSE
jgi:hypothetical protein